MDVASLGQLGVLRSGDVTEAREAARQKRLRRLAVVLAAIAVPLVIRASISIFDVVSGRPGSAARVLSLPLPSLPPQWAALAPGAVLIGVLTAVLVVPMIGAGRSPHVLYRPEDIGTRLSDVVGAAPVVEEVVKTLNLFLAYKTFQTQMGGNPRRGVLFEGPPGTGKTYIAKAMAAEAGVPFLFVSSSAFQSMYYGQTNRKIRSYFRALRKHARREGGAIGFIEEIDAIGASRSGPTSGGAREGVAGVVNELLIQLQSFDELPRWARIRGSLIDGINRWLPAGRRLSKPASPSANILVVGATNRATDLDAALLRPGRFDRTITVDIPSRAGRREIIDYYLDRKAHSTEIDDSSVRDDLAGSTFGYSPVMIEHLFDEALIWALRRGGDRLSPDDLARAKMSTELGIAQPVTYTDAERRAIATHEAGHAAVAWLVAKHRRLEVLSIIKRSTALGLLAHSETEERWTRGRGEMEGLIQVALGGMVAEELFLGETSSGVAGDLKAATELAAEMVGAFGMTGSLISLQAASGPANANLVAKLISDDRSRASLEELLDGAKRAATAVLGAHLHLVEALRDALLVHDELIGDQITMVLSEAQRAHEAMVVDITDRSRGGVGIRD